MELLRQWLEEHIDKQSADRIIGGGHLYCVETLSGKGGDPGYVFFVGNDGFEIAFDWVSLGHPGCLSLKWAV